MIDMTSRGLWHNRGYVRYRFARVASLLGSEISGIAYPLLVLHIGGGAAKAGAVASCWLLTQLVCQLPGGQLADRFDRRALMIGADVVRLAVVATIPLAAVWGEVTFPQLIVVAVVESAAAAAFGPAAVALIRDLVPGEDLGRALGQTQGFRAATSLIGPVVGGACYALAPLLPFVLDAASYGLSAVLLVAVPVTWRRPARAAPGADEGVTAGMRWLWRRPAVMRILAFASVINLVAAAAQVVVVVVLRQRGSSPEAIGVVMASVGAGGVVGALFAQRIMDRLDPPRLCLTIGVVWAAGFAAFAAAPSPWVIGPVLALMFLLSPAGGVMLSTITLGEAPHDMLGRVTTAEQTVSSTLAMAGPFLAGLTLGSLGASWICLLLGGASSLAALVVMVPLLVRRRAAAAPAEPARPN
jgi:MFS family permease